MSVHVFRSQCRGANLKHPLIKFSILTCFDQRLDAIECELDCMTAFSFSKKLLYKQNFHFVTLLRKNVRKLLFLYRKFIWKVSMAWNHTPKPSYKKKSFIWQQGLLFSFSSSKLVQNSDVTYKYVLVSLDHIGLFSAKTFPSPNFLDLVLFLVLYDKNN